MIQFTDDLIVKRLRWVMLGAMLFSMIATLAGQPREFWTSSERAIRFDGLSIYDHTNRKFEFFLGHGWEAYVLACAIYFAVAFTLVSVLPRTPALMAMFSLIFGHFYGGSNWLAVRWHYGVLGPMAYQFAPAIFLTLGAFPAPENARLAQKRLPWVAVGVLILDFANTLIGQPHSYWQHPGTVHEANALSRIFLLHGWFAFGLYAVAYCFVILWLASALPRTAAVICVFAFVFAGYVYLIPTLLQSFNCVLNYYICHSAFSFVLGAYHNASLELTRTVMRLHHPSDCWRSPESWSAIQSARLCT